MLCMLFPLFMAPALSLTNSQHHQHTLFCALNFLRPLILFPLWAFAHAITFLYHYHYLPGLLILTSLIPLISYLLLIFQDLLLPRNLHDQRSVYTYKSRNCRYLIILSDLSIWMHMGVCMCVLVVKSPREGLLRLKFYSFCWFLKSDTICIHIYSAFQKGRRKFKSF